MGGGSERFSLPVEERGGRGDSGTVSPSWLLTQVALIMVSAPSLCESLVCVCPVQCALGLVRPEFDCVVYMSATSVRCTKEQFMLLVSTSPARHRNPPGQDVYP